MSLEFDFQEYSYFFYFKFDYLYIIYICYFKYHFLILLYFYYIFNKLYKNKFKFKNIKKYKKIYN